MEGRTMDLQSVTRRDVIKLGGAAFAGGASVAIASPGGGGSQESNPPPDTTTPTTTMTTETTSHTTTKTTEAEDTTTLTETTTEEPEYETLEAVPNTTLHQGEIPNDWKRRIEVSDPVTLVVEVEDIPDNAERFALYWVPPNTGPNRLTLEEGHNEVDLTMGSSTYLIGFKFKSLDDAEANVTIRAESL